MSNFYFTDWALLINGCSFENYGINVFSLIKVNDFLILVMTYLPLNSRLRFKRGYDGLSVILALTPDSSGSATSPTLPLLPHLLSLFPPLFTVDAILTCKNYGNSVVDGDLSTTAMDRWADS